MVKIGIIALIRRELLIKLPVSSFLIKELEGIQLTIKRTTIPTKSQFDTLSAFSSFSVRYSLVSAKEPSPFPSL